MEIGGGHVRISQAVNYFSQLTRLVGNYSESDERNYVPCAEMYERYLANGCPGKENYPEWRPVDASTFGRVIRKVFPNATKSKRRTERGKPPTRVYRGLQKKNFPRVSDSCPLDTSFPSWSFLATNYSHPEWLKSSLSANAIEFIRVVPLLCNDRKVLQEVVIFNDWTFELKVMGRIVSKENIDNIVSELSKKSSMDILFSVLSKVDICKGFPWSNGEILQRSSVELVTEKWSLDNTEICEFRLRSPECSLGYPPTSKCAMCVNCYGLKRSTRAAAKEQSHVQEEKEKSRKPETLMSRKELIEKLHDEKKKRVNLERRERYHRIESDMKEFEESDHEDFVSLFSSVEKEDCKRLSIQ